MSFESLGLEADLLRAVREQGYDAPTPIQAQAIPAVLSGRDLMAGAQTGTGKTAGFTLPMLQRLAVNPQPREARRVRALGDLLVIAVNTEASIATNSNREPSINPCEKRMEVIAALDAVDYVVPLEASEPSPLIELFRPHIQAKGTDYTIDQMPERFAVEACGGRIEFVGDEKTHSSTALRQALRERGEI